MLDQADRLRQQDRQLLAHYDQLVQAVFMDMFGDPVRNEKGWPVKSLGILTKSFKYGTNQKSESDEASGSVPVIRIPNVLANKVNFDDLKFSVLSKKEFSDVRLEEGDLLFVRSNGNPAYIGRCAVFAGGVEAAYASYLIRARLHTDLVVPEFIQTVVSFQTYRPVVLKKATTTAGNYNINTQALKSLDVIVPPLTLQQKFIQLVTQIEAQKAATQQLQAQSEALFNSLLQQAFRGELTRPEPAAGVAAGQLALALG